MGVLSMIPVSILVCVFYFDAGSAESCANPNFPGTFQYTSTPCVSDTSLLQRQILNVVALPTELSCAYQCFLDFDCRHAIFLSGIYESCHLASNVRDENIPVSDFTSSTQCASCTVLRINPPVRCGVNGSVAGQFSCSCPEGYFGRYCEEDVPDYCQRRKWDFASTSEYESINSSEIHAKFLAQINVGDRYDFEIHNVDDVLMTSVEKICEFHSLLSWNVTEESFVMPPQLAFGFSGYDTDNLVTEYLTLDGVILDEKSDIEVTTAMIITEDPAIAQRLIDAFHDDPDSFERLANGLSKGHRLVHREPIRVQVDPLNSDVIFESLAGRSLVFVNLDPQVRAYAMYKQTFKASKRLITELRVANGEVLYERTEIHDEHIWALDDCWSPLQQVDDMDELTGILREILLTGKEVRVVMDDGKISSDIVQVTLTGQDVIAALAPYIAPMDSVSRLGDGTAIYSLLSTHKTLSTCDMKYQSGEVIRRDTAEYPSSVQWVVGKRTWHKLLLVNSNGEILFGDMEEVVTAAMWGKGIRVCLQYSDVETACFGVKSVTVKRLAPTVLLQSRSVLGPAVNGDGLLHGVGDDECRRTELLISSDGWVKSALYVEGNTNYAYENNVGFETMTWFVDS